MSAEDLILLCGQDLGRNAEQMGPIIKAIVQEAWCETEESLRELSPQQWAALTFADPLGNRQPLPARLVARIQQRLAERAPTEHETKPSGSKPSDVNRTTYARTDADSEDGTSSDDFPMPQKSFPGGSKSSKLSGLSGTASTALADDDDCSTAVPSEVLEDQSEVSVWDTGNLEDLGSCGVLSSAEIRAARLQRLGRAPKGQQGPSSSSSSSSTGVQRQVSRAQGAKAKAKSSLTKGTPPVSQRASLSSSTASSSASAAASSSASAALREERLAKLKAMQKATASSSAAAGSKSPSAAGAASGRRPQSAASSSSSTTASSSCSSRPQSAGTASSGYVQQPEKRPVQTEQKPQVVPQQIPKDHAGRPLSGDELNRHLDKASREAIREMGLWEYMPARNPVVTRAGPMGAHWHQSFEEYQHTLGGVPDPKPVERPAHADNIQRQLDKQSREALKEMGLWEKMPARNPVVTRQSSMGAHWHAGFGEFQHTLGGVPTPAPTSPPMRKPPR